MAVAAMLMAVAAMLMAVAAMLMAVAHPATLASAKEATALQGAPAHRRLHPPAMGGREAGAEARQRRPCTPTGHHVTAGQTRRAQGVRGICLGSRGFAHAATSPLDGLAS